MLEKIFHSNLVCGTLAALTLAASAPLYAKPVSFERPNNPSYRLHLDSELERTILLAANEQGCPPGLEYLPECQKPAAPTYVPPTPSPDYRPAPKLCTPNLSHLPECQKPAAPTYVPPTPSPDYRPAPETSSSKGLGWGFLGAGVLIGGLGLLISTYSYSKTSSEGEHSSGSAKYIGYSIVGIGAIGVILGIYHLAK